MPSCGQESPVSEVSLNLWVGGGDPSSTSGSASAGREGERGRSGVLQLERREGRETLSAVGGEDGSLAAGWSRSCGNAWELGAREECSAMGSPRDVNKEKLFNWVKEFAGEEFEESKMAGALLFRTFAGPRVETCSEEAFTRSEEVGWSSFCNEATSPSASTPGATLVFPLPGLCTFEEGLVTIGFSGEGKIVTEDFGETPPEAESRWEGEFGCFDIDSSGIFTSVSAKSKCSGGEGGFRKNLEVGERTRCLNCSGRTSSSATGMVANAALRMGSPGGFIGSHNRLSLSVGRADLPSCFLLL